MNWNQNVETERPGFDAVTKQLITGSYQIPTFCPQKDQINQVLQFTWSTVVHLGMPIAKQRGYESFSTDFKHISKRCIRYIFGSDAFVLESMDF